MGNATETIIVGLVLAAAVAYMGYKVYQRIRGKITCGDCSCGGDKNKPKSTARPVNLTIGGRASD